MKRLWVFGLLTFAAGILLQIVSDHLLSPTLPSPQWLLLAVLALGGAGETNLAQTLGFFWGLFLDVYGLSLFGAQGWLLALTGYLAGTYSRQLNAEKFVTQETLALAGTLFFWTGLMMLEGMFRSPGPSRLPGALTLLSEFLLNLLAAPAVFRLLRWWSAFWSARSHEHAARR